MSAVGAGRIWPRPGLTSEQKRAMELAADAELRGVQTNALLDAANFVLIPTNELLAPILRDDEQDRGRLDNDPEDRFRRNSAEIVADLGGILRPCEWALLPRLCADCPWRGDCLARAHSSAAGHAAAALERAGTHARTQ